MKFTQNSDPRGLRGPIRQADAESEGGPRTGASLGNPPGLRLPPTEYDYGGVSAMGNAGPDPSYRPSGAPPNGADYPGFRESPVRQRVKMCGWCGGAMRKSSRPVLSAVSGFLLIILGAGLMAAYGLAVNFFQVHWSVTFALPAAYYVGSLFVGMGILFFFIRERVWYCPNCHQVDKR